VTIEATLERIAAALERQAAALEAPMAAIRGAQQAAAVVAPAPAAEAPKRGPGRPPKTEAPAPAPAPAPVVQAPVVEESDTGSFLDDEPAPVVEILPTADDVRKALVKYGQKPGCSQEKARAILKQYGHVDTLKALKPEHFKAVIDAAS
jgi:hypothetical protein